MRYPLLIAVFELLADRLLPLRTLPGKPYSEIPDSVRLDAQWPAQQSAYAVCLVVPKQEIPFLYHAAGKLETRFVFKDVEISIPHGRFGGNSIQLFAGAAGWPMFWDGVPINLPNRSVQELRDEVRMLPFGRTTISYTAITAGFVLGILPMSLEFVGRFNRDLISTLWLTGWGLGVALVLFGWVALRRGF